MLLLNLCKTSLTNPFFNDLFYMREYNDWRKGSQECKKKI